MQAGGSPIQSGVAGTGTGRQTGKREQFTAEELAVVMSSFDIGVIDSVAGLSAGV